MGDHVQAVPEVCACYPMRIYPGIRSMGNGWIRKEWPWNAKSYKWLPWNRSKISTFRKETKPSKKLLFPNISRLDPTNIFVFRSTHDIKWFVYGMEIEWEDARDLWSDVEHPGIFLSLFLPRTNSTVPSIYVDSNLYVSGCTQSILYKNLITSFNKNDISDEFPSMSPNYITRRKPLLVW